MNPPSYPSTASSETPPAWAGEYFGKEAEKAALEQLLGSDAMLMGRRTYEMFTAMSLAGTGDYAEAMNSIRKYVFSSTLEKADWNNTTIISGDAPTAVAELKQQDGRPWSCTATVLWGRRCWSTGCSTSSGS